MHNARRLTRSLTQWTCFAGLCATAAADVLILEAQGMVSVNTFTSGPYAQVTPGDSAWAYLELALPGTVTLPGQETLYEITTAASRIEVGAGTSHFLPGGLVSAMNDLSGGADGIGVAFPALDFGGASLLLYLTRSTGDLWNSADLVAEQGVYTLADFDSATFDVLSGSAALSMLFERVTIRPKLAGTEYCFGDGMGAGCPCGNSGGAGEGCQNSSGVGARLAVSGSDSVSAADLAFDAAGLPAGTVAVLFAGAGELNGGQGSPFGDGLRCVGGSLRRLGTRIGDASGLASWGVLAPSSQGWVAGDRRRFQVWYADAAGGPCSSGFNVSSGIEVVFAP